MTIDETLNGIAGVLVLTGSVPIAGATLTYGFGSPWWRSWLGRVMFGLFLALVVVFAFALTRRTFGEYPGYGVVALVVYGYISVTLWAVWLIILVERRKPAPRGQLPLRKETINMGDPTEGGQHLAITTNTVPEIWYKAKRVARTVLQVVLSAATLWGAVQIVAPQILAELAKILPVSWVVWLVGALAFLGVVAGVITRIMAIPAVNAWLVKIGLGSVPAAAVTGRTVAIPPAIAGQVEGSPPGVIQ